MAEAARIEAVERAAELEKRLEASRTSRQKIERALTQANERAEVAGSHAQAQAEQQAAAAELATTQVVLLQAELAAARERVAELEASLGSDEPAE